MSEYLRFDNMILSFPVLAAPKPSKQREAPKFSAVMLIDPNNPKEAQDLQRLQARIQQVQAENNASLLPDIKPGKTDPRLHVNSTATPDYPPGRLDAANVPMDVMVIGQEFYPGAICNFLLDVYYMKNYNRVCIGLIGVQKVMDGPRLDNRMPEEQMFAGPIPVTGQQGYQQPPAAQQVNYQQPPATGQPINTNPHNTGNDPMG